MMLCSLCRNIVSKIGNKPTGATWDCPCGETHCRHISDCGCGRTKRQLYKIGDVFRLLTRQVDDDDHGRERETPRGSYVVVSGIQQPADNPYIVSCPTTGGWWFFSQAELEGQAELTSPIRPPEHGDYLGVGNECHTTIDAVHEDQGNGTWLVEDKHGEDFRIVRDPDNDNDIRRAWRLANLQSL